MTESSHFTPPDPEKDDELRGLEGWLVVAILGIVGTALISTWGALSVVFAYGLASPQTIVAVFYGIIALACAFIAFNLMQEKSHARWMAVILFGGFFVVNLVFAGTDMALGDRASTSGLSIAEEGLRAIASAAWLLYFVFSRRVKLTLVK